MKLCKKAGARVPLSLRSVTSGEHPLGDAGQLVLLGVFMAVWAADSFFFRMTTALSGYVPLYLRLLVLCLTLSAGTYLFGSGHVVISSKRRPDGVMSTGAFKMVRHPLYLAAMLFYLGLSVSTASLMSLALLVVILFFYDYIASYEERLLVLKFRDEYRGYMKRTGKWLLGVGKGR